MVGSAIVTLYALANAAKLGKLTGNAVKNFMKRSNTGNKEKSRAYFGAVNNQLAEQKAKQQQLAKTNSFRKKINTKLNAPNKPSPIPVSKLSPAPKVNVGGQLQDFKAKQNKAISKGLSNPVNMETKIKNIMGVN